MSQQGYGLGGVFRRVLDDMLVLFWEKWVKSAQP